MPDTLERIEEVIREVFEDPELKISRTTTAADVSAWDSLMHVNLLLNVERAFGIKFSSSEIAKLKNVGEMVDLVEARLKKS